MIDIRIIAVPERMENVEKMQETLKLPEENIFIDKAHKGVKYNAKRAWLKKTEASHVMVLADDAELCKDFLKYCNIIVDNFPEAIVSLFPFQFRKSTELSRYPWTPYVSTNMVSGLGIIMPTEYIKPCIKSWKEEILGDDTNIRDWALANGKLILTTIPAIIQHLDYTSIWNPSRDLGGTAFYDPDPSSAKWDLTYVNNYTNISRKK